MKDFILKKSYAWLQLIRLPNLFTIPGDIFAGVAIARFASPRPINFSSVMWLVLISLLLYSGGLILNDLMDRKEDISLNRKRPLVTGEIKVYQAWIALLLCFGIAIGLSLKFFLLTQFATLAIATAIFLYNSLHQKNRWLSGLLMGSCRSLNLLLGASIILKERTLPFYVALSASFLYILAISLMARDEAKHPPQGWVKWSACTVSLATAVYALTAGLSGFIFLIWAAQIVIITRNIKPTFTPAETGQTIGRLIRQLIVLQLCWVIFGQMSAIYTVILLFCYFLSGFLGKIFYSS